MNEEKNISIPDKIIAATNSIRQQPTNEFRRQLITYINELIDKDFNALVQLLYRIDINETRLKKLLNRNKDVDTSPLIADLIINRQLEKVATKKQFSSKEKEDDDERW